MLTHTAHSQAVTASADTATQSATAYDVVRTVRMRHPTFDVQASLRVSYDSNPSKHGGHYRKTATLSLETGACVVQWYATADQLRQAAEALLAAASAVEQANEGQQMAARGLTQ